MVLEVQAQGQAVPVQPGLWMTGTRHTVDGKPSPASQGPLGMLSAREAEEVRKALRPLGLPPGHEPSLECQTATAIDFQSRVLDMARDMCSSPEVKVKGTRTTFSVRCRGQSPGRMRQAMHAMDIMAIEGSVDAVSPTETRIAQKIVNTDPQRKQTIEVNSVARWLGADCRMPPQGLRAELFNQLVR
jgi:hypothetical protein